MALIRCVDDLPLYGGGLACLDLANTIEWRDRDDDERLDVLFGPHDLAHWTRHAGLADDAGERAQHAAVEADPAAARAELVRASSVREGIHDAVSALVRGERPPAAALAIVQESYAEAAAAGTLAPSSSGGWTLAFDRADPRLARFAAAASAVALLGDPRALQRVGRCSGRGCGWLFLDTSRGGRRRWCSMAGCGSREKMRRHYARSAGRDT